jgi:hypothetical protein
LFSQRGVLPDDAQHAHLVASRGRCSSPFWFRRVCGEPPWGWVLPARRQDELQTVYELELCRSCTMPSLISLNICKCIK